MGYVQKFDIQGAVASTKRRHTCGTPSIGRSRCNAVDRTFYDAVKKDKYRPDCPWWYTNLDKELHSTARKTEQ
jgi:hypothetical protein